MEKKTSLTKNYIYNLIYNVFNVISPLLVAPYISRVIGVEGVGIRSYTLSIVSNFIIVASLGTATYAQREIAICRDNKFECSKKVVEIGMLRFLMSFIVGIVYSILFIFPIFNNEYNIIYGILLLNIISNMLDFSWFFQGVEEFKKISTLQLITKIIFVISIFIFIKDSKDLNLYVLLNSLVLLANSIVPFIWSLNYCEKVRFKELEIKRHFKESMIFFIPTIAVQIYTVLDKTMIGVITNSTTENGYYEQADKLLKVVLSIVTSINIIMRSRVSYLYAKKDMSSIKNLILKSLELLTFFVYPIIFGIIAVADWFVPIFFGAGYDKVTILLYILSPIILIISISNLIGTHYYTPVGQQSTSNKFLIIGSIINLIINSILIKPLKSIGAAIASVFAELVITLLYLKNAKEVIKIQDIIKKSIKNIIASILMFIIVLIIKRTLEYSILNLAILIMMGILTYGIILIILKDDFIIFALKKIYNKIFRRE